MVVRRQKYTKEFKLDALRLMEESHRPVAEIARELGLNKNVLYRWHHELVDDAKEAFAGNGKLKDADSELLRLRRELETVTEERDILKKALAVFSRRAR